MKRVGIIGLGDMGIAMARNIIKSGFELTGFDLREERLKLLEEAGGKRAATPAEVGSNSDAVFVMVLHGHQVESVVSGEDGLLTTMAPGSTLIVSATINPSEVRDVASSMAEKGVEIIDTPVSGGKSGAEAGTLTMMAAAKKDVFENHALCVLSAAGRLD